jgi:glycosyltransferase involved in cell wall biosynthesis
LRVLRIYHGGRNPAHRARERALLLGIDVALVVPAHWTPQEADAPPSAEDPRIIELPIRKSGDVNRHAYVDPRGLASLLHEVGPDVMDIHEEPFSVAARQWLSAAPRELPVVMYTAQNIDKRFPPPFAQYERAAYGRIDGLYPCSKQAASVARGKGFDGHIDVLPLGYDHELFLPGEQSLDDDEIVLGLLGRLVPEKGVSDAIGILARVNAERRARLIVVGQGPEMEGARALAASLGLSDHVELRTWQRPPELAEIIRKIHVVLVPSRPTATWVEQFGRVIVEAQASGAVVAGYASGAIPEVGGEPAIVTAVGAAKELGDRVAALASNPDEYARRRGLGIELSRARTWPEVARRQAELYSRVVASDAPRLELPRSPRRRRLLASAEFGPTAATNAGRRPFALPLLRRGGLLPDLLATAIDLGAELRSRLPH